MSRTKPGVTEYPCGCSHDIHAWLKLCAKHEAEWNETHERWRTERKTGPAVAALILVALGAGGCTLEPETPGTDYPAACVTYAWPDGVSVTQILDHCQLPAHNAPAQH